MAQKFQLKVHLRIEDHDQSRYRPEHEKAILEDLKWLGLEWDSFSAQRDRQKRYEEITERWIQSGQAYYCDCSRKDIQKRQEEAEIQLNTTQITTEDKKENTTRSTKPGDSGETPYDGYCSQRKLELPLDQSLYHQRQQGDQQLRLRLQLPPKEIQCPDLLQKAETQNPAHQCGDLLLKDNRGQWTYNFCVTVDDLDENVDLIIRGMDLRHATGRQIQLREMLVGDSSAKSIPGFLHHPLLLDVNGRKLAKRDKDQSITEIRQSGIQPQELLGQVAYEAGLIGDYRDLTVEELGPLFGAI